MTSLTVAVRSVHAFVVAALSQLLRDRSSLFFMVVLPIAIMTIIGSTFGGTSDLEIAVVDQGDPALAARLETVLDGFDGVTAERFDTLEDARRAIRRLDIEGAVVAGPDDAPDASVATIVPDLDGGGSRLVPILDRAITAATVTGDAAEPAALVPIDVTSVGEARFSGNSDFALTAAQNLVLFTFINALTSSALLIAARRQGVIRRAFSAPTPRWALGVGIVGGWLVIALVQSLLILGVAALGFGVDWGDPLAAAALVVVFALVGTGLALLAGSIFSSEDQVGAFVPAFALVLAALGGCMVPSEVFPDSMLFVSRLTPHYWALEGWKTLVFDGGGVGDIARNLSVLAGFAVVSVGVAVIWLDRVLRRSGEL